MVGGTHPVAAVLRERHVAGSRPGARADEHRVALVLEGGGMRGVVSAGMTAALERLGLTPCFDLVVGASAGAINGAAFLAGAAERSAAAYWGPLASRSFVSPLKVIRRKPVIDVKQILDLAAGLDAAGHEKVLRSAAQLLCVAVDVETAETTTLSGMGTREELWAALLASSRMPWAGGEPVEIGGRRYLDGGMASPIPVREALAAGATHVLALQTRPFDVPRRSAIRAADWFIERHLGRLNPALVPLYRRRVAEYEVLVEDIGRRSAEASVAPPHVLGIRPAAGTPCVGQLERRSAVLAAAASDAERLVEAALSTGSWLRVSPAA
ncbi:MAG TPA: patatin-like phospholipase family protein [Solirubrobacteraceae bacterium]|nr:patatin-like phospholipase family protein [Solirubrobacteraceae bacterium]